MNPRRPPAVPSARRTLILLVLAALVLVPALAVALSPATTRQQTPRPLGDPGRWSLRFDDEFSGSVLNRHRWNDNWFGRTRSAVTAPANSADVNCVSPSRIKVGGGRLTLTATAGPCRTADGQTFRYTGSLVDTRGRFSFAFGFLQARIWIPAGVGGQPIDSPAFWADGMGNWPATGELDVMEVLASCGPAGQAGLGYHFHSPAGALGGCARLARRTGWHTFGADWRSGSVTYFYDGRRVGRVTSGITSSPMYLILNQAVDPTYGGPTGVPASIRVDYVRVWQRR